MDKVTQNIYRTHTIGEISNKDVGNDITISGWLHRKRDHGGLLFTEMRDHYGEIQCVIDANNSEVFKLIEKQKVESVLKIEGTVRKRDKETINGAIKNGDIEIEIKKVTVLSKSIELPMQINTDANESEDIRLRNRFLDLRRYRMHRNIVKRSEIIQSLRQKMIDRDFLEIQTPILTSSSPEGARDYVIPSRLHHGKFYALPQAPQQFKQLLMVSGFDRYFQIAPCFRDEDSRKDRSPGEFYQLDFEMAFATQEDVFNVLEPVLREVFTDFCGKDRVDQNAFRKITYADSMEFYGTDKPDLRNPLIISDVSDVFLDTSLSIFKSILQKGGVVKAIKVENVAGRPRSFFDNLNTWARDNKMAGLGYILFKSKDEPTGPFVKFLAEDKINLLQDKLNINDNDGVFFICDTKKNATNFAGICRTKIANEMDLIDPDKFIFCWIYDFPMYELNEQTGKVEFSHNPFSMPQGGINDLLNMNPLDIKAYQYDIVCNGIELSSGAVRNHLPDVMYKAFEIAGYSKSHVDEKFSCMINAFKHGAPPHAGCAPGIDRIIMLILGEENLREVIAFPMNQQAEDLLMGSPGTIEDERLRELSINIRPKIVKNENTDTIKKEKTK